MSLYGAEEMNTFSILSAGWGASNNIDEEEEDRDKEYIGTVDP